MTEATTFSCTDCSMKDSAHCGDCLVTFLCNREPDDAVVIDAEEARAVRLLARAGLVSSLKYEPKAG